MDAWDVQRMYRRRRLWALAVNAVGVVVMTGILGLGVAYAVAAIARGDVW